MTTNKKAAPSNRPAVKIPTEAAAPRLGVKPATMRRSYCIAGEYLGLVPVKLPNGRLLWDAAAIESLTAGEVAA